MNTENLTQDTSAVSRLSKVLTFFRCNNIKVFMAPLAILGWSTFIIGYSLKKQGEINEQGMGQSVKYSASSPPITDTQPIFSLKDIKDNKIPGFIAVAINGSFQGSEFDTQPGRKKIARELGWTVFDMQTKQDQEAIAHRKLRNMPARKQAATDTESPQPAGP